MTANRLAKMGLSALLGVVGVSGVESSCCAATENQLGLIVIRTSQESTAAVDPSEVLAWITPLEERRLFRLAAEALDQVIDQQPANPLLRAAQVRRLRVEAAWGVETSGAERQAHWDRANELAAKWVEQTQDPRSIALLKFQWGLSGLAQAETLRDEDLGGAVRSAESAAQALTALKAARDQLEEVDKNLIQWMNDRSIDYSEKWEPARWLALQRNVRFHRARADLERGHWYDESQRIDRMEAFQSAAVRLDEVNRQTSLSEPLGWQIVLAQARASREIQQLETALEVLVPADVRGTDETWLMWIEQAPVELRGKLIAERFRLEKAAGAGASAGRWASQVVEGKFGRSADLDLMVLERLLDRWEESQDEEFQNQAVAWAKRIETEHGPYWGRRASRMLVGRATAGPTGNVDLVMSIADERTLQGRLDEAEAGYREALVLAEKAERPDQVRLASIRLGALAQNAGEHGAAARWFARAATESTFEEERRKFVWYALWNRLRELESGQANEAEADALDQQLQIDLLGLIELWPNSVEASDARLVVTGRRLKAKQFVAAIEVAVTMTLDDPAIDKLAPLIDVALESLAMLQKSSLAQAGNDTGDEGPEVSSELSIDANAMSRVSSGLRDSLISSPRATDAEGLARRLKRGLQWSRAVALVSDSDQERQVAEILQQLLAQTTGLPPSSLQIEVQLAQLVAAVRSGTLTQITAEDLQHFQQVPTSQLLEAVEALSDSIKTLSTAQAKPIAELQLRLIEATLANLPAAEVSQQVRRDRCRIDALMLVGQTDLAIEKLTQMATAFPNDGGLQRWIAERWVAAGEPHRAAALDAWRKVGARSAPQTDGWFEARYWVARLTAETGDRERALQLLKYLQSIPPGWDEAPNRDAFDQLLRQLER